MEYEKKIVSAQDMFPVMLELLDKKRQASFIVTGMSMWPFLCHGRDSVIIEACDVNRIKKGDIVLISVLGKQYLLHRVTKILPEGFETTGDGNCFHDGVFPRSFVKARVSCIIRKGKRINCFSIPWKFIFRCWMLLFPVRNQLLFLLRELSKIKDRCSYVMISRLNTKDSQTWQKKNKS